MQEFFAFVGVVATFIALVAAGIGISILCEAIHDLRREVRWLNADCKRLARRVSKLEGVEIVDHCADDD